MSYRGRAFTLIELMAVVGILALVIFFIVPNLDAITPRQRLQAAARRVASTMDLAQGRAIADGREVTLVYDLQAGTLGLVLPKPVPTAGAEPTPTPAYPFDLEHGTPSAEPPSEGTAAPTPTPSPEERETLPEDALSQDVEIAAVALRDRDAKTTGRIEVVFSPLGDEGSHVVQLRLRGDLGRSDDGQMWVRWNALTRSFEVSDKALDWPKIPGSTGR